MAGTTFPATIVKSPTCTITEVEWEEAPGEPEPVIVTTYVPRIVGFNRQEPEAPPFADSLTGVLGHATVRPVFGLTDEASVMFPAKLKLLTRDTEAEVPEAPRFTLTSGLAVEMVKSPTWTTDEACCEVVPGKPELVTVTRYIPAVEEDNPQDALLVPLAVMGIAVAGQFTVRPLDGFTVEARLMEPAKLKVLLREMAIDTPDVPELKSTGVTVEIVNPPT